MSYSDIPMSCRTFKKYFACHFKEIDFTNRYVRMNLTIDSLKPILGKNFDMMVHPTSSTHQRIVGNLKLFYRPKIQKMFTKDNCPRY